VRKNTPWPRESVAVLAHGAGSTAEFLQRAFPADRLGVAECRYVENRSGDLTQIQRSLRLAAITADLPVILGGVSLGGHAAAALLASSEAPPQAIAGLVCLPAWLGAPEEVASMTASAAADIAHRGSQAVLAELDPTDWVVNELAAAWRNLDDELLATELRATSRQPALTVTHLAQLRYPIGVVALANDPLHPQIAAQKWAATLPRSGLSLMARDEPAADRAVFADHARRALTDAWSAAGPG